MPYANTAGIVEVQAKVKTYCNEFSALVSNGNIIESMCATSLEKFPHHKQRTVMPENKSFLYFY